jgi:hypothetical protein
MERELAALAEGVSPATTGASRPAPVRSYASAVG